MIVSKRSVHFYNTLLVLKALYLIYSFWADPYVSMSFDNFFKSFKLQVF